VIDDLQRVERIDGSVAVDVEEGRSFSVGRLVRESPCSIAVSTAIDFIDDRQDIEGGYLLVRVLEHAQGLEHVVPTPDDHHAAILQVFQQALPKPGSADFPLGSIPRFESLKHGGDDRPVQEGKGSFGGTKRDTDP
jgi:hypothetical protein